MFSTGVAITCPLFTFHDVSINTLAVAFADVFSVFFTFHDVSINTAFLDRIYEAGQFFTFHDVSINTENSAQMAAQVAALHSTMFLLIPMPITGKIDRKYTLHSTMFLLIRRRRSCNVPLSFYFTFHDVSINTIFCPSLLLPEQCFTFHDVSINTRRLFILTIQI